MRSSKWIISTINPIDCFAMNPFRDGFIVFDNNLARELILCDFTEGLLSFIHLLVFQSFLQSRVQLIESLLHVLSVT